MAAWRTPVARLIVPGRSNQYGDHRATRRTTVTSLPTTVRQKMERSFGHDFSAIRVHVGPGPARVGAAAFACGEELHFDPDSYRPHDRVGQQNIGHELAHIVQQRTGRAAGRRGEMLADPLLEAEADDHGRLAARGESITSRTGRGDRSEGPRQPAAAPGRAGVAQPILKLKGGRRHRQRVMAQMNQLLPVGVTVGYAQRTNRFGRTVDSRRLQLHGAAPPAPHHGYDLVARMIQSPNKVRIRPTTRSGPGRFVRGQPSLPQAHRPPNWRRTSTAEKLRLASVAASTPGTGAHQDVYLDPQLPAAQRQVRVEDPGAANGWTTEASPEHMVLGHELVHADRTQRGYMASDMRASTPALQRGRVLRGAYDYERGAAHGAPHWFDPAHPNRDQAVEEMEEIQATGLIPAAVLSPGVQAVAGGTPNFIDPVHVGAEPNLNDPNAITENMLRAQLGMRRRGAYRLNP